MKFLLSSAVLGAALLTKTDAAGIGTFFTYFEEGGLGPSNWAFLDIDGNQCGGTQGQSGYGQSPVTITKEVSDECDTDLSAYDFRGGDCTWDQLDFTISNNGVKVGPKADAQCTFGQMDIPHKENAFNALQFHIHTYSEHEIEGQGSSGSGFFPAELHVVHQETTAESFAVFGTMIDVGSTDHEMFEWFLQGWEAAAQKMEDSCMIARRQLRTLADEFEAVQQKVQCPAIGSEMIFASASPAFPQGSAPNVYELPTDPDFGVYTYKGGLTTPGCTEIVNWNLLDKAMSISGNQMSRLESLILCYVQEETDENGNFKGCIRGTVADAAGSTSRPPQPLKGRKVTHRCRVGPAVTYVDVGELPIDETEFVKPAPREEPSNTKDEHCDRALYEECSSDPRFNPTISPNLKAAAPIWNDLEGYWVGVKKTFDAQGRPLKEVFSSTEFKNTVPYPSEETKFFMNLTVQETRFYEHNYRVHTPASAEFCALPVPDKAGNSIGEGKCGVNGYAINSERFGVASFEKDGSAEIIMASGIFEGTTSGKSIPVGSNSFYKTVTGDEFQKVETSVFSNEERTAMTGSGQYFIFADQLPYSENPLAESYTFIMEQVSEETFKRALEDAYVEANVLTADRVPVIENGGDCVDENICPTEERFAENDPALVDSPYQEDPVVKPGFIAMFVILVVGVLLGAAFVLHKKALDSQSDRYREQFAKRIAETIEFTGKHEKLTPEALEDEFRRLDKDKDGVLDKSEMQLFMGDKMSQKDFDAMFIAMDIDHSGTVEFAEFCSFLTHAFSAFDRANANKPSAPAADVVEA